MEVMKINITKKQYWDLMRAVYMADWMANAICERDMAQDKGIKDIRNYIFSFAREMGREKYVEIDEEDDKVYASLKMDDDPATRSLIQRYDEHVFWDELIEQLGERDFFEKYTKEQIQKMNREECFQKRMECEDVWGEECENFGIDRLGIKVG